MRRCAIGILAAGACMLIAPGVAGAVEGPDAATNSASAITITQTDSTDQRPCVPAAVALTRNVSSTPDAFTLTVKASAPPCEPINATAVVYAMPGNGEAWPQTLVEKKDFTINSAGVTVISFAKACDAVQFDVITGATPDTISPAGPWHGPLLFPFDTSTSLQYWGCVENETSTTASTTPTTESTNPPATEPTESTVPDQVLTATTIRSGVDATISDPAPVEVEGISEVAGENELAFTGSTSGPVAWVGLALLIVGAGLLVLAGRREANA